VPGSRPAHVTTTEAAMAKGQIKKAKHNKPKLSIKEKQAKKKEKRASKPTK
jgi:hypothetical protein